eukprot:TRINITY_DN4281_c0_g1_i1.p1 TRINITY_DN4281_c0_g1~~TRINITY_DN4281_c0_g1_i1.p1  ORF type:complete len:155 (-),score=33.92 TRINITY_DN4281_c0_g1_i1:29-493(-)
MHAMCLELLRNRAKPGMKVLDVGSGSGYLSACFAKMVGETGKVVGIETVKPIYEFSLENIKRGNPELFDSENLIIKIQDGWKGDPENAPFDAIHVGAAASELPQPLIDQLQIGGRLIIPVGTDEQYLMQYDKHSDGKISSKVITGVRYVPLIPQ